MEILPKSPQPPGGDVVLLRDGRDARWPRGLLRPAGGSGAGEVSHGGGWERARARGQAGDDLIGDGDDGDGGWSKLNTPIISNN